MHSDLPKVLHPLAGRPCSRMSSTLRRSLARAICVVYGHGGEQRARGAGQADLVWAKQEEQWAPGMPLAQALPIFIPDDTWCWCLRGRAA